MAETKARPVVVGIEGGRAIQARKVEVEFREDVEEALAEVGSLAGYTIVVWDDEGMATTLVHNGDRSPYSSFMVPEFVKSRVKVVIDS